MSLEKHFTVEMEKEIEEQRKLVTIAEQVYRRAVDNLNAVNERWICDWKHSADIHQEMEVKRITYLRSTLWTFANMLTSTFNIDEECCDRIRAALEITDVQKDITDFVQCHRTGSKLPSPIPYESFYKPVKRELYSQQPSKESLTHSVTVLTNPDEELKSVDHQLQQLEQLQTPRLEPANDPPLTGATVSTHSHVSSAMKEVEQMLNQTNDSSSAHLDNYNLAVHESTDRFSADICNALGIKETQDATSKNDTVSPSPSQRSKENGIKYKPMPNPSFTSIQSEHVETEERPMSETQSESNKPEIQPEPKKEDDDDDDKEIEEYQSRMPRPPPKDEKWVISSIRRPQQVPIKTPNHEEIPRSNTENLSHQVSPAEDNKGHQPKVHKPVVPLTIEIPNPVNPTKLPQLAAHQVIEDARRHSQMSPATIEMNRQQNRDDNGGIRPAPWQDSGIMHLDDKKGYMPNMNGQYPPPNGYHAYHPSEHINSHPRGSSLAILPNHQDFLPPQHAAYPEEETNKKRSSKNKAEATGKSGKESKGAGRFSLFFTGNKKDKKKEKENQQQQQIQPYMLDHQQRPQSHYQTLTKEPAEKDVFYNPPVSAPMPPTAINGSHKFICYVKAQWPFEATVNTFVYMQNIQLTKMID
ncbi:hypothetical protein RMATCC62417_16504 [Rhizopus microsporus]|nr:hypothetical protein RMATCC62417_16504 [Rhizopus microsporus]